MDKYEVLKDVFGYSSFRDGQEKVIDAILSGKDALAIMPTGAGKSVCFQIPALILDGVTLVVSPLISLMKDQVNALTQNGIKAAYINGSLSEAQIERAIDNARKGEYKIIYVAPERLSTYAFRSLYDYIDISLVCIDEAHCVSQWGQDFRPSYLEIKSFISSLEKRPVLCAVTATATEKVRKDIVKLIGLKNPDVTVLSFDRKNLYFASVRPKSKPKELRRFLDLYSGKSGIVYCSSRKRTDAICKQLSDEGYSVTKYHAGMSAQERKRNQELFINDEKEIIVATNAFGMGIDKSNVSFVIHYNMPGDIESYYQEAGRAGRDGCRAECILFYNAADIRTQQFFIDNPEENDKLSAYEKEKLRKTRLSKLHTMIDYAESTTCLRKNMLSYFGEEAEDDCKNCSVCIAKEKTSDITTDAQKVFSCIARVSQKENKTVISDILLGNKTAYIAKKGYDSLSTFSIMKNQTLEKLSFLIDYLESTGYIGEIDSALYLKEKARQVLFSNKRITAQKENGHAKNKNADTQEFDKELFERLRILRKKIADEKKIPDFVVFTDASLKAMARAKPQSEEEFIMISGVGQHKLELYGAVFIKEISKYMAEF